MAVFPFTVRATDSEGSYADRQFSITVRNSRIERFMIINSVDAWTSPDATTWTYRAGQGGTSCAYGNGFWLTTVNSTSTTFNVKKSTDGINYQLITFANMIFKDSTGATINTSTYPALFNTGTGVSWKVRFYNGKFYMMMPGNYVNATTSNINTLAMWTSVDGITWTQNILLNSTAASSNFTTTISGSNGQYVQYSESDGALWINNPMMTNVQGYGCYGWSTTDGVTYTPIKNVASSATTNQYSGALTRINGFYMCQNNQNAGASQYTYSTDGLNWTLAPAISAINGSSVGAPLGFVYMNGTIYGACGQASGPNASAYSIISTDGISWTTTNAYTSMAGSGLVYALVLARNGTYIVTNTVVSNATSGSQQGTIRVSYDGTNFANVLLLGSNGTPTTSVNDIAGM